MQYLYELYKISGNIQFLILYNFFGCSDAIHYEFLSTDQIANKEHILSAVQRFRAVILQKQL